MYPLYSQNNFLRCSVLWQNVIVLLAVPRVLPPKRECKISMFFSRCQVPRRYFFKIRLLIRLIYWYSIELINVNIYIIILISDNNFPYHIVHNTQIGHIAASFIKEWWPKSPREQTKGERHGLRPSCAARVSPPRRLPVAPRPFSHRGVNEKQPLRGNKSVVIKIGCNINRM